LLRLRSEWNCEAELHHDGCKNQTIAQVMASRF
jgi:hypothetical protein